MKKINIPCYFCDSFSKAIAKRDEDGKITKLCQKYHVVLDKHSKMCYMFLPSTYFFCNDKQFRTTIKVCKERRRKKTCFQNCSQAKYVDEIIKMERKNDSDSGIGKKSFTRIDIRAADNNGNSPNKKRTEFSNTTAKSRTGRKKHRFRRITLS
jgi:hypothetical protein